MLLFSAPLRVSLRLRNILLASDMQSRCHVYRMKQLRILQNWPRVMERRPRKCVWVFFLIFVKMILGIIVTVLLQLPKKHMRGDRNLEEAG